MSAILNKECEKAVVSHLMDVDFASYAKELFLTSHFEQQLRSVAMFNSLLEGRGRGNRDTKEGGIN